MYIIEIHYIDIIIILLFLLSFIGYGLTQFKNSSTNQEYFLGNNAISWKKSMFSIVATETSLLTFMSLPGIGFRDNNLFFLQLALGYIIGRILSAYFLIPMYYKTNVISIYQLIGEKFDLGIQKLSSVIFLVTRLLADGVRFLLTAIVIQQILGFSIESCILIIGIVTVPLTPTKKFYKVCGDSYISSRHITWLKENGFETLYIPYNTKKLEL